MAETQPYVPDDLSLSAERRVDAVCRRFEGEWQAGRRPDPDEFLTGWDGPERAMLAHELALIDMDYRRQTGEATTASNYRRLFTPTPVTPTSTEVDEPLPRAFGRYQLRRLLGRGGMGSVYLAHDAQLDRDVALKIPRPFGENPTLWRERFFTEARAAAALRHENICPVHDVGEHDGQPYLTMAFIDGETLSAKLKAVERLPVAEAVATVAAVAQAMAEAHAAGVVHRDLKPGNVMIDRRGRPVVMDFGLALRTTNADDLRVTLTGVALGTPAYMPPEQAGGDVDAIGPPADVYALGVILFELVTGGVPFRAKSFGKLLAQIERDPPPVPSSLNPDVPPALDALVLTALSKSPADRFPTAAEFADALEAFQAGEFDRLTARYGAALARAEEDELKTRAYPVPPKKRGRGLLVGLAAGFLAFLVLVAGAVFYVRTDHGDLKVELEGAEAKDLTVKVNGKEVVLDEGGKVTTIRAGANQMLEVSGPGFKTESQTFEVIRGKTAVAKFTLVPKDAVAKKPDEKAEVKPGPDPGPKQIPDPKPTPPKPVEFPKDKTLIEAGGWQILADATKDQMQAWLDEKKKAKQSVMWLDAIQVGDKPLFTAVAVRDDRQPKWKAMLDVSVDDVIKMKFPVPVNLSNEYPRSIGGFSREDGATLAILWHPEVRHWGYQVDSEQGIEQFLGKAGRDEVALRVLRPFPMKGDVLRWAFCVDYQLVGSGKPGVAVPPNELEERLAAARTDGGRPICLSAATSKGELIFSLAFEKNSDKREWDAEWGLPAEQLAVAAKDKSKLGFRPDCVTAYAWDGAVRYCVVWVKEPPKPTPYPKDKTLIKQGDYETLLDATKEQMQTWLDEKKKAKHSVLWLDAVEVAGKPLFSAVAALDDRVGDWVARTDEPAVSGDRASNDLKALVKDRRFVTLSGFPADGKLRSAFLLHPGKSEWTAKPSQVRDELPQVDADVTRNGNGYVVFRPYPGFRDVTTFAVVAEPMTAGGEKALDQTAAALDKFAADRRKAGHRVSMITAYPADGVVKFAAVSAVNPDKLDWATDTGLSAAKFAEAAKEKAKTGFRPQSVTAYAWDGAVRYCVVWVKDPPKKEEKKDPPPKKDK